MSMGEKSGLGCAAGVVVLVASPNVVETLGKEEEGTEVDEDETLVSSFLEKDAKLICVGTAFAAVFFLVRSRRSLPFGLRSPAPTVKPPSRLTWKGASGFGGEGPAVVTHLARNPTGVCVFRRCL